jgi:biotin transporter BioY
MKGKKIIRNKVFLFGWLLASFFLGKKALAQWSVDDLREYKLPDAPIFNIIENIFFWVFGIMCLVSLISFIIAGLMYLTSAGEQERTEKAKKAMLASITGVVVGLSGFVVLQAVTYMLGGTSIF